ncbi:MAG: phospholipid/cholesterol/gamma-HCH transport system substrate-binding protein [Solirubrobacterales bacterium]|nr:phospholipid/cholesterol/gamma-HCH transport system substrate-binding protein [Solirubrobacterales bacterium]
MLLGGSTNHQPRREHGQSLPDPRVTKLIGAAVVALAVAIVAVAYFKPNPLPRTTVKAVFSDASGIGVVGQQVRAAGVPVGEISDVQRSGDSAVVTMKLDGGAPEVHRDATAELRPHLAFEGTAYVDLTPGTPGTPGLGDTLIPLARTQTYVPLDEALRTFQPDTRRATKAVIRETSATLGGEGAPALQRTLRGAPALSRSLAETAAAVDGSGDELAGAVAGMSRTAHAIASRDDRLQPLIAGTNRTLAAIGTDGRRQLDATIAQLPAALDAADRGGRATVGIVDRLDPLARDIEPGLASLPLTLDRATPLVGRAGPVLDRARPLVANIREALTAGADATPATQSLMHAAQPSLDLLNSSLLPALHKPTAELGIPSYLSFLNLFEGGGGASRPYEAQPSRIPGMSGGQGHFMRFGLRFLTGVGIPLPPCSLLGKANQPLAAEISTAGGCTP